MRAARTALVFFFCIAPIVAFSQDIVPQNKDADAEAQNAEKLRASVFHESKAMLDRSIIELLYSFETLPKFLSKLILLFNEANKSYLHISDRYLDWEASVKRIFKVDISFGVAENVASLIPKGQSIKLKSGLFETNPKKLKEIIASNKSNLEKLRSGKCFAQDFKISENQECQAMMLNCGKLGFGSNGDGIYVSEMLPDLSQSKVEIESTKEYFEKTGIGKEGTLGEIQVNFQLSFCKLSAMSGNSFSPSRPNIVPKENPKWAAWKNSKTIGEAIKNNCTPLELPNELTKKHLKDFEGDEFAPYQISGWLGQLDEKMGKCKKIVPVFCSSVKHIGGVSIYTYPTKNCALRSVTENDVSADIRRWKISGMEEASILEHAEIIDIISNCEAAKRAGFDWDFELPDVSRCSK